MNDTINTIQATQRKITLMARFWIFITILLFYVVWLLVKDNMLLLGSILGQIIGVGAIAIILSDGVRTFQVRKIRLQMGFSILGMVLVIVFVALYGGSL